MHGPDADTQRKTAAGQPEPAGLARIGRNPACHIQGGVGCHDGNDKRNDDEDLVVLANLHDATNSFTITVIDRYNFMPVGIKGSDISTQFRAEEGI